MKTYCISDIHGHLKELEAFRNTLEKDDHVYVLGDIVDKGDDPIGCLRLVMNDERFECILGNHEYMMWQFLSAEKGTQEYEDAFMQWIAWNRGEDTYNPYLLLDEEERKKIYDFIEDLPLNIPDVEVNSHRYYLVHSVAGSDVKVRMKDLDYAEDLIYPYIWDRPGVDCGFETPEGRTVIAGHTAVQVYEPEKCEPFFREEDIRSAAYIDIDGGLAYGLKNSHLIALCLDDLEYKLY